MLGLTEENDAGRDGNADERADRAMKVGIPPDEGSDRNPSREGPDTPDPLRPTRIVLKRYAAGKVFIFARVRHDHVEAVSEALRRSIVLEPQLDEARFFSEMEERGISRRDAKAYVPDIGLADEAWLQDVFPT
jgi:hypothetical protein